MTQEVERPCPSSPEQGCVGPHRAGWLRTRLGGSRQAGANRGSLDSRPGANGLGGDQGTEEGGAGNAASVAVGSLLDKMKAPSACNLNICFCESIWFFGDVRARQILSFN